MVEINGHEVTFKDALSNREFWKLTPILASMADLDDDQLSQQARVKRMFYALDYDDLLRLLTTMIETWDFDGDPSGIEAYEALDPMRELMPMFGQAMSAMGAFSQEVSEAGE